jgi:outer membrane protein assembly factor BamB
MMIPHSVLLTLALLTVTGSAAADDWPGWRGPTGQGVCRDRNLPLHWGGKNGRNILWKALLPGQDGKARQDQNQSSPIVSRGRVFVTASCWPAGVDVRQFPEHHVACYRVRDGKRLWDTRVPHGPWSRAEDLRGGYTAPTPAADGERIYVVFGSAVLAALDYDGKLLWRREIVPYKFDVAMASSPVVYRDTVLLQCDGLDGTSRLAAFDRKSGEPRWQRKRPEAGFCHSTPVLVTLGGTPRLLVAASGALQGVDPDNGRVLWWCAAQGDTVSPVYGDGLVYLDSGRGGSAVAVEPGGSGDVTKSRLRWKLAHVPEGLGSPVFAGGYLYRLCNPATLRCWKMADGTKVFDARLDGASTSASPVVTADGRIYFASAGRSYLVRVGPRLEVLARNDLDDPSPAAPAVADGRLFLKGQKYLYCVGRQLTPAPPAPPGRSRPSAGSTGPGT